MESVALVMWQQARIGAILFIYSVCGIAGALMVWHHPTPALREIAVPPVPRALAMPDAAPLIPVPVTPQQIRFVPAVKETRERKHHESAPLHLGPHGGCYSFTKSGDKSYHSRSRCK